MSTARFNEFSKTTKEIWKSQVLKDLKGKSFEETLVWQSLEGINIQPYYAQEDVENLPFHEIQLAQTNKVSVGWQNRPLIKFSSEKTTNTLIINTLQSGAEAIILDFEDTNLDKIDFIRLLDKIKLSDKPIYFKTPLGNTLLNELHKFVHYQPKGGIIHDPIAYFLAGKGETISNSTWENTKKILLQTDTFPLFSGITVESHIFHNAGATATQELAFALASAVTYVDKLSEINVPIDQIAQKIEFSISIGTNYFIEIAKLRSLRFLWKKILDAYQSSAPCQINGQPSLFYDSALSAHTNMLRATTEAMSAVMGGADSLTVHAYDAIFESDTHAEMGERIAKNVSILLKEESYLDKVQDPSAGSYYIENLTAALAQNAWNLFLTIEAKGGILPAFEEGFIQAEIEKSYQAKIAAFEADKIMVGVNKFQLK